MHMSIPLIDAIHHISIYARFMKDILTKRKMLGEFEIVVMTKEFIQLLHNTSKIEGSRQFFHSMLFGKLAVGNPL
jgi:hypothetical protein